KLIEILLKLGNVDIGPLRLHPCSDIGSKLCLASRQVKLTFTPVRGFNFVNSLPKPSVGFRFDQIDDYSYPKRRQNYPKSKKYPPPLHSLTLTLRIEATINGLSDLDVQVASDHPKVLPQSRSSTYIRGWRLR